MSPVGPAAAVALVSPNHHPPGVKVLAAPGLAPRLPELSLSTLCLCGELIRFSIDSRPLVSIRGCPSCGRSPFGPETQAIQVKINDRGRIER